MVSIYKIKHLGEISSLERWCCDKILAESEMVSINKVKHFRGSKRTGDMVL